MISEKDTSTEGNQYTETLIKCPVCDKKDHLMIPSKIINESKQLTTVSVPKGLICGHSFQVYIDKNYVPRGYQKIDFEFSKMEFFEGKTQESVNSMDQNLNSLDIFEDILYILRECVDDKEVIGSALLTVTGKVLYSSLPHKTLLNTIKEFEVRNQKKLIKVRKMFLELENKQKVCSIFTNLAEDYEVILILIFSKEIRLGMGSLQLREVVKKIKSI
ncbi:MAG: hypothetical protein EU541_00145 [Promethearchaeota archaeon]|nr:MAG: hypothetical protein EU541_00145 [Candidatus Lokiarchaeota archaeon]